MIGPAAAIAALIQGRTKDPEVLHAMQAYGGGFAAALAEAWFRADAGNSAKLYAAFGDLYDNYACIVRDERERRDAKHSEGEK